MIKLLSIACLSTAFILAATSLANADYDISAWNLLTYARDNSGTSPMTDFEMITTVSNPFLGSYSAGIRDNIVMSQYDMSWIQESASFGHDFSLYVEEPEIFQSLDSRITLVSDHPTSLSISSSLDFYSVPGDLMDVFLKISIRDVSSVPSQSIFSTTRVGGNSMLFPSSGTLTIEDNILLQPNIEYLITWYIKGDSNVEPNPAGPLTIDGSVHLTLTAIPEPHTALLLLCIAPLAIRRRRFEYLACRRPQAAAL